MDFNGTTTVTTGTSSVTWCMSCQGFHAYGQHTTSLIGESIAPLRMTCGFATGHAYAIFDATRIYCQKCGEFRNAEV